MEGRKKVPSPPASSSTSPRSSLSPSPSFASELFGSKDTYPSSSSSTGIFGSIFGPPSKVLGREFLRTEGEKKREFAGEPWNSRSGSATDDTSKSSEQGSQNTQNREVNNIYQDQRLQPCHLSSSIYYGGQENYSHPQNSQRSGLNSTFKKDGGEDDSGSASRGNWWQGSLYY